MGIRNRLTPWVLRRKSQLENKKGKARETIETIVGQVKSKHITYEEFREARESGDEDFNEEPDRIRPSEVAWGQYLNEEHQQQHVVGTYGTSAAIQILNFAEDESKNELQEQGLQFLRNEWDEDSQTWRSKQMDILYRIVAFRRAMEVDGCSDFDIGCPCERIWQHKQGESYRRKWGEYNYENDGPTDEVRNVSTAIALYALRDSPNILSDEEKSKDYHLSLCNISENIKESDDEYDKRRIVNQSLCLLALTGYWEALDAAERRSVSSVDIPNAREKKDEIESKITDLAKILSKGVKSDVSFLESYYIRLFTTPRPKLRDRYYPFAVGPITALAILKAGEIDNSIYGRNIYFLTEFVDHYTDQLNLRTEGRLETSIRGEASIGDHLWVTEALDEFTKIPTDEIPRTSLARAWPTQLPLTNFAYLVPIILILGIYGYFSLESNGVEAAITTILSVIIGALLIALGFSPALGEWIRRTL